MTPTIMAIIMIAVIIGFALWKKVPMPFVLAVVPFICALLLGFNITKVSGFAIDQLNTTMKSAGYLLAFALMYFSMLTESGMFDIIIDKLVDLLKGKMNVYVVMILTTVIASIGFMTADVVTTYMVVFPVMIGLYEKMHFDKKAGMIITQTAVCLMGFLPWGVGVVQSSVFAKVDPLTLSEKALPISLCFIPVIILQWIYFGMRHKKQMASMPSMEEAAVTEEKTEKKVNPNARPQFFWINLIVFFAVVIALGYFKFPPYIVFIFAAMITTLVNYPNPKDFKPIWTAAGSIFYNTLLMLFGISIFLGIFSGTGMTKGIAALLVSIFPKFLARYLHIILLALCVIVIRFVPWQIYSSLYPILISIAATFGLPAVTVIAPFVPNLALATGSSPMSATTHVGTSMLKIDVEEYCNFAVPIQTVTNILVIIIGLIFGVIQ